MRDRCDNRSNLAAFPHAVPQRQSRMGDPLNLDCATVALVAPEETVVDNEPRPAPGCSLCFSAVFGCLDRRDRFVVQIAGQEHFPLAALQEFVVASSAA